MRTVEFEQTSVNGGFPLSNDDQDDEICHGTGVYVVSKRSLMSLLYRCLEAGKENMDATTFAEIAMILDEDKFVMRGSDLPAESLARSGKPSIKDMRPTLPIKAVVNIDNRPTKPIKRMGGK